MGYTTEFRGAFKCTPSLTKDEVKILNEFSETRHGTSITSFPDFPGFWCDWVPTINGAGIAWNGAEKFYSYVEWLNLIIDKYLTPWGVKLSDSVNFRGENFDDFGRVIINDTGYAEIQKGSF